MQEQCLSNVHHQCEVVLPISNTKVAVAVTVIQTDHNDNHQSSLEETAPNYKVASSTAVTTSKLTLSLVS